MRYNERETFYITTGHYPFHNHVGEVKAPQDRPDIALQRAKEQLHPIAEQLLKEGKKEEAWGYQHPTVYSLPDVPH